MLFHVAETVFLELAAEPGIDVLHDAQRTNHAAIKPAEKQGEDDDDDRHDERQGKQGWNKLDSCRPTCPMADAVADAHKEKRYHQDHDDRQSDSEFA